MEIQGKTTGAAYQGENQKNTKASGELIVKKEEKKTCNKF